MRQIPAVSPSMVACSVAGLFLALAALGKVAVAPGFADIIQRVTDLSPAIALPTAYAMIGWEAALAVALWWGGWRSRLTLIAAVATLVIFSIAIVRLSIIPNAPKCGCFGLFGWTGGGADHYGFAIARNAGIVVLLAWSWPGRPGTSIRSDGAPPSGDRLRVTPPAFTIIELLVVMVVLGILLAITVPGLRGMRARARDSESLSGLRQVATVLGCYASDYRDSWPYIQTPADFSAPIVVHGVVTGYSYFGGGRTFWANTLVPGYIEQPAMLSYHSAEETAAANARDGLDWRTIRSRFVLADVAFARPDWFVGTEPPSDARLFAATRHGDVRFPSRKGALIDGKQRQAAGDDGRPPFLNAARVDGAAARATYIDSGLPSTVPRWQYGVIHAPIFSTRDGWRGVDEDM